jgi:hypothetical protein
VVLDIDPRHDGMRSIEELEYVLGVSIPDSPIVITGGGGTHTYLAYPDDGNPVPSSSSILPGIDVKADGGYVVAPPSNHTSGRLYAWNPWLPMATPIAAVPEALLVWLREKNEPSPDVELRPPARSPSVQTAWEAVKRFSKVRKRFDRDPSGLSDASPSGVDYSLACMLAACGCGADEIRDLIEESRSRAGLSPKRPSYYRATIGKALRLTGAA